MEIKDYPLHPSCFHKFDEPYIPKEKLEFDGRTINLEGFKNLFDWLKFDSDSLHLIFRNGTIGESKAEIIAECLKVNKTLVTLSLEENFITDEVISKIAEALKENKTLKTIHFDNNLIGDKGVEKIIECLEFNNTITDIYLSGNLITNGGAKKFAEYLKRDEILKILDFRSNLIKDDGKLMLISQKDRHTRYLLIDDVDKKFAILHQSSLDFVENWNAIDISKLCLSKCEDLTSIPDTIGRNLGVSIILPDNVSGMQNPPPNICKKGREAIAEYFWAKKINLLGNAKISKMKEMNSTLQKSLKEKDDCITKLELSIKTQSMNDDLAKKRFTINLNKCQKRADLSEQMLEDANIKIVELETLLRISNFRSKEIVNFNALLKAKLKTKK